GDGKQLGSLGYQAGGPQPFIAALNRLASRKEGASPPPSAQEGKGSRAPEPVAPMFNGAKLLPPPKVNDLVLKGLSGGKNNRLAMINNQTFGVGDSATLTVGGTPMKVKCLEIRESSVLVSVNGGEPREVRTGIHEQ